MEARTNVKPHLSLRCPFPLRCSCLSQALAAHFVPDHHHFLSYPIHPISQLLDSFCANPTGGFLTAASSLFHSSRASRSIRLFQSTTWSLNDTEQSLIPQRAAAHPPTRSQPLPLDSPVIREVDRAPKFLRTFRDSISTSTDAGPAIAESEYRLYLYLCGWNFSIVDLASLPGDP